MIKIGITGSIASGKTTASKILSFRRGPLFSADKITRELYRNINFKNLLIKEFKLEKKKNIKFLLKKVILKNQKKIKKLEKIIHPIVRKKMRKFYLLHKKEKKIFYEIPLLIESKLMNYFDIIIFIKASKKIRLKRFKTNGGNKKLFDVLDKNQLTDQEKIRFANHVVVNEKNLDTLKKNLSSIIKMYE
jgi:dephospho-CoA kinase